MDHVDIVLRIAMSITLLLCVAGLEIWPWFRPRTADVLELLEVAWPPEIALVVLVAWGGVGVSGSGGRGVLTFKVACGAFLGDTLTASLIWGRTQLTHGYSTSILQLSNLSRIALPTCPFREPCLIVPWFPIGSKAALAAMRSTWSCRWMMAKKSNDQDTGVMMTEEEQGPGYRCHDRRRARTRITGVMTEEEQGPGYRCHGRRRARTRILVYLRQ